MARLIVVEVLDGRGAVASRARLSSFPATIGRGYDADIIVDDPYVSARHLRIVQEEDGGLVAEDLASVKRVYDDPTHGRVTRVPLSSSTELRIGRTTLRFRAPDHPVPEALTEAPLRRVPAARLDSVATSIAICAVAYAVMVLIGFYESHERETIAEIAIAPIFAGGALALWAGVWAIATRAVAHRFRFLRHFTIAALGALTFRVMLEASEWLAYIVPDTPVVFALEALAVVALVAALLFAHLSVVSAAPRTARWRWAAGVTGFLMAIAAASALASRDDFSIALDDPGALKPLGGRWVVSTPVASFATGARSLKDRVDSLSREK